MGDKISDQALYVPVVRGQRIEGRVYLGPPYLVKSELERDLETEEVKKKMSLGHNSNLRESLIAMYRIQYVSGALQVEEIDLNLIFKTL